MKASPMSLLEEFIKEAFGSQYVIPVYQRNYTWKKNKQVKQLLVDIENILKGETKQHFIGTVVYNIVNTNFMVREREVVDGQQRLITMFLIAYVLRNIAREKGETDIAEILTTAYLENTGNDKYKYRLQPSGSDDDAFSYIAKDTISLYSGESIIMDNYKYLYFKINELVDHYSILDVINAIREIYIVRIELDPNDDAQQIFESINSTGQKLTAADLIRNYIMMRKTNEEQENIFNEYWIKLETIFQDSKKIAEFFRFYLASKIHILIPEKDLYDTFKSYWKTKCDDDKYSIILKDIVNFANHYNRLYFSDNEDELGEAIKDYRKLQSFMPAPFTMVVLEHLRLKQIKKEQAEEVFNMLNSYLIRRYLCDQDSSAISRFFPGYLRNVEEQINVSGNFNEFVDICCYYLINENLAKSAYMPDDKQLRTHLETANAYALSNIRFVLDKVECYGNPAPVDLSKLSIEHIMPQTQNSYWAKVSDLDDESYTQIVNVLGNLTLAAKSDNSKMGNKTFDDKKKILFSTKHLKLNSYIIEKESWTINDIKNRTQLLIDEIIEIYPYKKSSYKIEGLDSRRYIFLKAREVEASGYLNENNSLTVFEDSQIQFNNKPTSDSLATLREELLEKEIIKCRDGIYLFVQRYTFNSPSAATDFILGGSNNGWNYWKDSNEQLINDSLRTK